MSELFISKLLSAIGWWQGSQGTYPGKLRVNPKWFDALYKNQTWHEKIWFANETKQATVEPTGGAIPMFVGIPIEITPEIDGIEIL